MAKNSCVIQDFLHFRLIDKYRKRPNSLRLGWLMTIQNSLHQGHTTILAQLTGIKPEFNQYSPINIFKIQSDGDFWAKSCDKSSVTQPHQNKLFN